MKMNTAVKWGTGPRSFRLLPVAALHMYRRTFCQEVSSSKNRRTRSHPWSFSMCVQVKVPQFNHKLLHIMYTVEFHEARGADGVALSVVFDEENGEDEVPLGEVC